MLAGWFLADAVIGAELDETPGREETPRQLALRLAAEKAASVAAGQPDAFVLAADTVVAVGRRILPKVETPEEGLRCLALLSGRAHRVLTGIAAIAPGGERRAQRLVESRVWFKRLSQAETAHYLASGEGQGKAGGYAIQGLAGGFVMRLQGSYSGIVGLPLYETRNLLNGLGYQRL